MGRGLFIAALAVTILGFTNGRVEAERITVFAAASLSAVVSELLVAHADPQRSDSFRTSYAASSTLAQQISNGAPADIFISANPLWVQHLKDRNLIVDGNTAAIISNHLSVIVPQTNQATQIQTLAELPLLLKGGRLAVGNPTHVPAGQYAKAALQAAGQWEALRERLIPAAHVRAALRFVESGEAPAGIVYASDAWNNERVKVALHIPADLYPKIEYVAAMLGAEAKPAAKAFFEFLQSERAAKIYQRYGFSIN